MKICLLASILTGKWHDITWPRKGPKFNSQHPREISMILKIAALIPKSGIVTYANNINYHLIININNLYCNVIN